MDQIDWKDLLTISRPWFHIAVSSEKRLDAFVGSGIASFPERREGMKILRGERMYDVRGVFQEFAAAFQFPYYFGSNWDALIDCMRTAFGEPSSAYITFISRAEQILKHNDQEFSTLISCLRHVAVEVNSPEEWYFMSGNKTPHPLHIVFQVSADNLESTVERFAKAGLEEVQIASLGGVKSP